MVGVWRGGRRDGEVKKLQEASGHEKEEGDTENEALLSLLMADCLPAIRAQSRSLIDRLRGRRGWEKRGSGTRVENGGLHKTASRTGGSQRRSLMIKKVAGQSLFSPHASGVVSTLRLVL